MNWNEKKICKKKKTITDIKVSDRIKRSLENFKFVVYSQWVLRIIRGRFNHDDDDNNNVEGLATWRGYAIVFWHIYICI